MKCLAISVEKGCLCSLITIKRRPYSHVCLLSTIAVARVTHAAGDAVCPCAQRNLINTTSNKPLKLRGHLFSLWLIVQNRFSHHLQTANQLSLKNRHEDALEHYQQALAMQPDAFQARYNLAVTLRKLRRWEQAREQFETLLQARPNGGRIHNNLAIILQNFNQHDQAEYHYRRAIECNPQLADAHFNLGMLLLRLGRYEEGWQESEWRWKTNQFTPLECPKPRWDGRDLNGTLLLHTEQGAGDAMQFIRFVPQAAQRCQRILLVCPSNLVSLFESIPGIDEMRQAGNIPLADFDAFVPLMSLPYLFNIGLDEVLTQNPYLFAPKRDIVLPVPAVDDAKLKVGIVWAGSVTHKNDQRRSCTPVDFLPLLEVPGTAFYSLQVAEKASELSLLANASRGIVDLQDLQSEFGDAAVLIEQLDLVITVDTAILHLTAAMSKPVWGLLSAECDWRWLLDREDSPWYPSLRLFRQPTSNDWEGLFQRVKPALVELLAQR